MAAKELTTTWGGQDKPEPVSVVDLYSRLEGHKNQAWAQRQIRMIDAIGRNPNYAEASQIIVDATAALRHENSDGIPGTRHYADVTDADRNTVIKLLAAALGVYREVHSQFPQPGSVGTSAAIDSDTEWQRNLDLVIHYTAQRRTQGQRAADLAPGARM